jgi:hypothetical protein
MTGFNPSRRIEQRQHLPNLAEVPQVVADASVFDAFRAVVRAKHELGNVPAIQEQVDQRSREEINQGGLGRCKPGEPLEQVKDLSKVVVFRVQGGGRFSSRHAACPSRIESLGLPRFSASPLQKPRSLSPESLIFR